MTDNEKILEYFEKHKGKGITNKDAMEMGIARLSARISELRKKGFVIRTDDEPNVTKRGTHARYFLEEEVGA